MKVPRRAITFPRIPELTPLADAGDSDALVNLLDQQGARQPIDVANWEAQYPYKPLAMVAGAHDGTTLVLDFFVRCNYLKAENYQPQSPVSQDSCVEFFVTPPGSDEYWNFEFNCIGAINASHRHERPHPTRLSQPELDRILVFPSCGRKPFCEVEGMFTWNLLVAIPLESFGVTDASGPIRLKGNFYKCAAATSAPHYLSWNPITTAPDGPDFHRPECFGDITLA